MNNLEYLLIGCNFMKEKGWGQIYRNVLETWQVRKMAKS